MWALYETALTTARDRALLSGGQARRGFVSFEVEVWGGSPAVGNQSGRTCFSVSAIKKASSRDWSAFSRGSQCVW
ncbi:hypothetical protein STUTZSP0542_32950 [Stutzerimonas marianensis]